MSLPLNQTDVIYSIMNGFTVNVTGSWGTTGILLILAIMLLFLAHKVPIEYTVFMVIPLTLVMMAYSGDYLTLGGLLLVYAGIIVGKYFFFRT